MWGFSVMLVNVYILYETAHLIICCKKKNEVLSRYKFRKEIALIWIQKKTANAEANDNKNNIGRDDVTKSSVRSPIETRERKKRLNKATRLNEKTLDPVGGALWCRIDTSLCHLPDDNLFVPKKRSL